MQLACLSLLLTAAVGAAPPAPVDPEPPPEWRGQPVRLGKLSEWTNLVGTNPDGRELVFTCGNKLAVYDLTAGKVRLEFTVTGTLQDAAVSPDGKLLVTSEWRDGFKIRDYRTGKVLHTLEPGGTFGASRVGFTPDGRRLVGFCYAAAGTVKPSMATRLLVYDINKEKELGWPATPGGDSATRLVRPWLHGFGPSLLVSDREREKGRQSGHKVWVVDPDTGKPGREVKLKGSDYFLFDVSPDGKRLICMAAGEDPRVVDLTTGKDVRPLTGHKRWVTSAAFSPGGARIATASGTTNNATAMALTKERPPREGATEIIIRAAQGDRVIATWSSDAALDFSRVGFSANGRYIYAVAGSRRSGRELWLWGRLPKLAEQPEALPTEQAAAPKLPDKVKKLVDDLAGGKRTAEQRVEALYLAVLSRLPTKEETAAAVKAHGKKLGETSGLGKLAAELLERQGKKNDKK